MNFGIIAEGVTDQVVIEEIICAYLKDSNIEINPLQPKNKIDSGGWTKVFDYCKTKEFRNAFDWLDYVIIQLDTDAKESWPYENIPAASDGDREANIALRNRIIEIIKNSVGTEFFKKIEKKVLFAIAIESIECWILTFHATRKAHKTKVVNCLNTLNSSYLSKLGYTIDPLAKAYDHGRHYQKASKPIKKGLNTDRKQLNTSLVLFLECIESKCR
ncbi:MAG: hypothetical protein RJQ09_07430 [Cyclobacteriaceae bacterium]